MRKCPRCLKDHAERPVISRRDTKTEICTACGLEEALVDLIRRGGISRRDTKTEICTACGLEEALVDLIRRGGRQLPELVQRREDRIVAFIKRAGR